MKKILQGGLIAIIAIAAFSCGDFKKTDGGLLYKFYQKNSDARKAEIGDIIEGYVILKIDTTVFYKNTVPENLFQVEEESVFAGDINEGLLLLHEGDSASFRINMDSIRKYQGGVDPSITAEYAEYTIKVTRILTEMEVTNQMADEAERMKPVEDSLIAAYIKDKKLNAKKTETGLYFVSVRGGSGAKFANGQTVSINYIGRLLDGRVFDGNWESELKKEGIPTEGGTFNPFEVTLGVGQVIPGFEEALSLMQKGSRATVIIPSWLGYGAAGTRGIPPYSSLVFDLEVR